MLKTIMLPTDSSPESERAIPIASGLASAQGAEVLLVQVVTLPIFANDAEGDGLFYQQTLELLEQSAQANLDELASRLRATNLTVKATRLLGGPGTPAWALLDFEKEHKPDLVVMGTHGRTGLARFALGSVADRMVRDGTAPVLLIREAPPSNLQSVLVMLDGSGLAEEALEIVKMLAGHPLQAAKLFEAVDEARDRRPATTYLEGVATQLAASGLTAEVIVDVGDPTVLVHNAAEGADLVALCTHGRGGFDRFRHGSVAERVVRESNKPVLLVRTAAPPD